MNRWEKLAIIARIIHSAAILSTESGFSSPNRVGRRLIGLGGQITQSGIGREGPGEKANFARHSALLLIQPTGTESAESTKTQLNIVMKTSRHLLNSGIRFVALLLIGFTLNARSVPAQTFRGETKLTPTPASLRAAVYQVSNSPMLRVRYDNQQTGPVRIQIRDQRGTVIYDEVKRQSLYAGEFDLMAWPAGTYIIELQTSLSRYVQTIRVEFRSPVVATVVPTASQPVPAGAPMPKSGAVAADL